CRRLRGSALRDTFRRGRRPLGASHRSTRRPPANPLGFPSSPASHDIPTQPSFTSGNRGERAEAPTQSPVSLQQGRVCYNHGAYTTWTRFCYVTGVLPVRLPDAAMRAELGVHERATSRAWLSGVRRDRTRRRPITSTPLAGCKLPDRRQK